MGPGYMKPAEEFYKMKAGKCKNKIHILKKEIV
ncbi:hypothetical protein COLO4_33112 [Corchorus olitorius]|uniref:Uncharacterized protein n=1 Tax=Corchorus olitorius TaxID=93759 RepID=A0A1R3GWF3_9ROSI|nr:hypothetical protein COLO4_33112 [Corchorus olitorius]